MKTVRSIELPDDVNYKLTKKRALNKNFAMIYIGQTTIGSLYRNLIRIGESIAIGRSLSNLTYTTEVTKIRVLKDKIVFHTLNSVYELVEVNDPKDTK